MPLPSVGLSGIHTGMKIEVTSPGEPPVSVETLRLHLSMNTKTLDPLLTEWLQAANEYLMDATGFVPTETSFTATLTSWPDGGRFSIPRRPITAITGVTFFDENGEDTDLTALVDYGTGEIQLDPQQQPQVFNVGAGIVVRFTAGLAPLCPARWKTAVRLIASHWYANREETTDSLLSNIPLGAQPIINQIRGSLGVTA